MTCQWKFTDYDIEYIKSNSFRIRYLNMKTHFTPQSMN